GFGLNYFSSIELWGSTNISINEVDVSWTGNTTPTGYGILIPSGSAVDNLSIDRVTSNNRERGIHIYSYNSNSQSTNVQITNSNFDDNNFGLSLNKISGLILSNLSSQRNKASGVVLTSIDAISINNVNVTGSANGLAIGEQQSPIQIVSGMFTGFGLNYFSSIELWGSTNISINEVDVSWTGNTTPTGYGILIPSGSAVNNLSIDRVKSNNRDRGIHIYSFNSNSQSTNVQITNSNFNDNNVGISLHNIRGLNLNNLGSQRNKSTAIEMNKITNVITINNVNVTESSSGLTLGALMADFNIVPGMFTGFGTNYYSAIHLWGGTNITISGIDVSWTGNTTPTGYGILIPSGSAVNNLSIDRVTSNNRDRGIHIYSFNSNSQSTNVQITNSNFDDNNFGLSLNKISGLILSNLSSQRNKASGVVLTSIDSISINNVNVTGSANGLAIGEQQSPIQIVSGMFTGFGTNPSAAITIYNCSGLTISGIDVSWTGSTTKTGHGICHPDWYTVDNLIIEGITVHNRHYGIWLTSYGSTDPSSNIVIKNSFLDDNNYGIRSGFINNITINNNSIKNIGTSLSLGNITNYNIFHNNICNSSGYAVVGDGPYELWNHTTLEGNYWCLTCDDMGFIPGTSSNRADILDNYAYGRENGWLPIQGNPNTRPCSQNNPPVAQCQNVTVYTDIGSCTADASINNGSSDPDNDEITITQEPPGPYSVGTTSVILTATDPGGLSSSCTANVTVVDNVPPVVLTKNPTVTLVNGTATITIDDIDNGSYDNCGIGTMSLSKSTFDCSDGGKNVDVILTVTDVNGNTATGTASVTVMGGTPIVDITTYPSYPVPGEQKNTIYLGFGYQSVTLTASGGTNYSWTSEPPGFTSNVPNPTVSPIDTTTYTVTVTNDYGCTATMSLTVIVIDWRCGNGEHKVKICHNGKTICIDTHSVQEHLNHGDRLGDCNPNNGGDGDDIKPDPQNNGEILVELKQNNPNPFATSTEIQYFVSEQAHATIVLTDIEGREIVRLIDMTVKAGWSTLILNGSDLSAGTYFLRLESMGKVDILGITKY
ncbi:MAG: hypothetical protein M1419_08565, partial [Bacteroidetes bacterium]|nr:hypothetical protein [Bacteroidota bacterium]